MDNIPELGSQLVSKFLDGLPLHTRIVAEYIVNMGAAGFIGYIIDTVLFGAFDIFPQSTLILCGVGFLAATYRSYRAFKSHQVDE